MNKSTYFLPKLCLSSLIVTLTLIATTSASLFATEARSSITTIAQTSPDTAKLGSVGGPLAKELQGKPAVVDVYATWCGGCKNIAPTLSQLQSQYKGKINFVVLDVTDKATLTETQTKAKKLGLTKFLDANKSKTSTVAIVDPATGNILALYQNNADKAAYANVLDTALAKK